MVFDLDDDGIMDIIGGEDSIWISQENDASNKSYFYSSSNEVYNISIGSNNNTKSLIILERDSVASYVNFFQKTPNDPYLEYVFSDTISLLDAVYINHFSSNHLYKDITDDFFNSAYVENIEGFTDTVAHIPLLSLSDLDLDGDCLLYTSPSPRD